jgi:hypothetical protein
MCRESVQCAVVVVPVVAAMLFVMAACDPHLCHAASPHTALGNRVSVARRNRLILPPAGKKKSWSVPVSVLGNKLENGEIIFVSCQKRFFIANFESNTVQEIRAFQNLRPRHFGLVQCGLD